ncbi:hypothetical protein CLIM01_04293 [Colletotrichum limetticola]|uniref:Uncharacterized protein n=1 Tax=Colletotrichum limetticola TaxID=1209924 RepID=A0ABQ9Q3L5_9PEZI|nr:hypothetical protein CLIM01_04293 [Colletotrichum limetticola]
MGERTGSRVFQWVWSYVAEVGHREIQVALQRRQAAVTTTLFRADVSRCRDCHGPCILWHQLQRLIATTKVSMQ